MKGICTASVALAMFLGACGDDEASRGARAQCAVGGELSDCPDAERTAEGACWRMVECGAIAIEAADQDMNNQTFDWDNCVNYVESRTDDRQRAIINCVAASTCDSLRADGSPDQPNFGQLLCMQLGRDF
jgi:hypothetical protein